MIKKNWIKFCSIVVLFLVATALTTSNGTGNLAEIATNVTSTFSGVAQLITAAAYVAGMGFAVGAIAKFKQHQANPTQVPLSQPVVFLIVGVCMMFAPTLFSVGGQTLFGSNKTKGGVTGVTDFA